MRYKLPDLPDEAEAVSVHGGVATFEWPGLGRFMMPVAALTEVPPPIPPEPEPGAYDIGGVLCVHPPRSRPTSRYTWLVVEPTDVASYRWALWADVWDLIGGPDVTIRRLVPGSGFGVTLPWAGETVHEHLSICVNNFNGPILGLDGASYALSANTARAMAAALWAAADGAS